MKSPLTLGPIALRAVRWLFFGPGTFRERCAKVLTRYRLGKMQECWSRARDKFDPPTVWYGAGRYELTGEQAELIRTRCSNHPLITLVLLGESNDINHTRNCILSIVRQQYPNWELLVMSARPASPLKRRWVMRLPRDKRIRQVRFDRDTGSVAMKNAALESARGEFVGYLNASDELPPDALTWFAQAIDASPEAHWLYSDEDELTPTGDYWSPHYKPDFSPYTLLASPYTGDLSIYRTSLLAEMEAFRKAFEGAEDHDLMLRLSERVADEHVVHIPRVLYHRRSYAHTASRNGVGLRAVEEALHRRGFSGTVAPNPALEGVYSISLKPVASPKVVVIVATRDALDLLRSCIASLHAKTRYPNYEVIVIDNRSYDPEVLRYMEEQEAQGRLRRVPYDAPFNHSDMHNQVIAATDAEFMVLMNNDVEMLSDSWLEQMVATVEADPQVGGVGTLLFLPDDRVQHAGVIMGLHGICGHAHRLADRNETGYFGRLRMLQEVSAVTGALVLLRRSAFMSVGGFDAERYPTSLNDINMWLNLRKNGWRCIYNPEVQAIHHETATRTVDHSLEREFERRLRADWPDRWEKDPFYNPNLALNNDQFAGFREFPVEEQLAFLRSS